MLEGEKIEPLGIARNFYDDKELMEKTGLTTYDIKKNPEYKYIVSAINYRKSLAPKTSLRVNFKLNISLLSDFLIFCIEIRALKTLS